MMHNYEFKILLAASPEIDAVSLTTPDRALSPRALYQDVAERLRERIFSRELEPGSWIDEQKLAADFGISRTPMREALKVLAVEGLVTMKVRRGAYVTEMSVQDVKQVYHVLALLESDAAGGPPTPAARRSPSCAPCTNAWSARCISASSSLPPTKPSTCSCSASRATAGRCSLPPTCGPRSDRPDRP